MTDKRIPNLLTGWKEKRNDGGEDELTGMVLTLLEIESMVFRIAKERGHLDHETDVRSFLNKQGLLENLFSYGSGEDHELMSLDQTFDDVTPDDIKIHFWPLINTKKIEDSDVSNDVIEPDGVICGNFNSGKDPFRIWIESKTGTGFSGETGTNTSQLYKQLKAVTKEKIDEQNDDLKRKTGQDHFLAITQSRSHVGDIEETNKYINETEHPDNLWKWLSWKQFYRWIRKLNKAIAQLRDPQPDLLRLYSSILQTAQTYMEKNNMSDFTGFDSSDVQTYCEEQETFTDVTRSIAELIENLKDACELKSASGHHKPFIRSRVKPQAKSEWVRSAYYFRLHPEELEETNRGKNLENQDCLFLLIHFFNDNPGLEIGFRIHANKIPVKDQEDRVQLENWIDDQKKDLENKIETNDDLIVQKFSTNKEITTTGSDHSVFRETLDWVSKKNAGEFQDADEFFGIRIIFDDFLENNSLFEDIKKGMNRLKKKFPVRKDKKL